MASLRFVWIVCLVYICAVNSAKSRKKSVVLSDVCSSVYTQTEYNTRDEYYRRVKDPHNHITTRLMRYFTFGGILQAISEETGIPRDKLVEKGASQFQDQSSGLGQTIHAAHIIRVGAINSRLKNKNPSLNRGLENYIGHTQNVLRIVNVWHGVGGAIDRYQSDNLNTLSTIDFDGLSTQSMDVIEQLKEDFFKIVDQYVQTIPNEQSNNSDLETDREIVHLINDCMLFENGTLGYGMVKDGSFVTRYARA
uniref:Uncharacterized protein n=1 Tax=Anopheles funestus TaxID=62324 RepID=A0A1Y9HEU1_ANOFN